MSNDQIYETVCKSQSIHFYCLTLPKKYSYSHPHSSFEGGATEQQEKWRRHSTRNRALGFVHLKLQNMGWPDLHSGQQGPRGFVAVQQCSNTGLPKNYLLLFVERFFKNRSGLPKSQLKVDLLKRNNRCTMDMIICIHFILFEEIFVCCNR